MATLQQGLEAFALRVANAFNEERKKPNAVISSNGLIMNGAGLLGNNTNFTKWTFDPTDRKYGGGCFVTDSVNADFSVNSLIPVNPFATYEISFFARTQVKGNNGNAFFYIAPCDADGLPIAPLNTPLLNLELAADWTNNIMKLTPESYEAFKLFRTSSPSAIAAVISYEYTTRTGYTFRGQYSRNTLSTGNVTMSTVTFIDATNEVIGITPKNATLAKAGQMISVALAGASYMYPLDPGRYPDITANRFLVNAIIPEEWTEYKLTATPDALITRLKATPPAYVGKPRFTNIADCVKASTSYISLGWLMNRGTVQNNIRNKTALSGISMRQV